MLDLNLIFSFTTSNTVPNSTFLEKNSNFLLRKFQIVKNHFIRLLKLFELRDKIIRLFFINNLNEEF